MATQSGQEKNNGPNAQQMQQAVPYGMDDGSGIITAPSGAGSNERPRGYVGTGWGSGVPEGTGGNFGVTFGTGIQQAQDSVFNRMRNSLDPVFADQERSLTSMLATQGLPTGGEAYGRARDQFDRQRNLAYENAALSAVGAGNQLQNQMFNQQLGYGQLAGALSGQEQQMALNARNQAINEAMLQRQLPINELSMLLQGTPATPYPQFNQQGGYQMQAPDVMGAMNSAANRKAQSQSDMMSGLFGVGSALIMSSREFKDAIEPVDIDAAVRAVQSLPVEMWRYKGDDRTHIGTYAEDFRDATGVGDGKTISIIDALGLITAAVKGIADRLDRLEARA